MQAAKGEPGGFVSDEARERFIAAYDRAFTLWPRPWTEFDVETAVTTTHIHRYGPAEGERAEDGPAEGEPVVLLHAAGFNGSMWYPNVAALGREHPVFAIDTPGDPNRSVPRAPIAEPQASAEWLDQVLGELGINRAHLVGASYGGWIALNQARRAPGRVASITLLDPAGLTPVDKRFWWWFSVRGLAALAPRPLRRRLAAWLGEPTLAENEMIALMWAGIRAYRMEQKFPGVLTDDELRRIDVPALLLTGRHSALISPREAEDRAGLMPDAQAEVVTGSRHGPSLEQAGPVNERITAFIAAARDNQARR
jgi:pimeloyl-ACP methyl ester carboxylesterase